MKLKSLAKGLLVTAALALTITVSPMASIKAAAAEGTYTVERDDYLKKIAKKVYGDEELWKLIYDANSSVIKNNYIIYKGQVLVIPDAPAASVTPDPTPATPAVTPLPTAPETVPTTPEATPIVPETVPATPEATPTVPETVPATPETTPSPVTPTTETTTMEIDQEFVLDYDQIASWVSGGFAGLISTDGAIIFATDSENDYGIIIFTDDSNMTAVSFVGPITYTNEYMTITDEANGLALTCAVSEVSDGTLALDMGNLGVATVDVQTRDVVLDLIKTAIDNYTHIA